MAEEIVTKKIEKIAFGMVSPNMIKKVSTVNVSSPELYDADGYPVEKGLMDLSMGVIDPGLRCKVCGGRMRTCQGHFGNIVLARPVIHILYISQIHDFLRSFCANCGRILLTPEGIESWRTKVSEAKKLGNIETLHKLLKGLTAHLRRIKKCPYCKEKRRNIRLEKPTVFYDGEKRLWPVDIRERLEKIPDEDLLVRGIDPNIVRPEWTILTKLLVSPITIRPSITLVTGERSEDDLTHKLSDVVRVNQRLLENINAGAPEIIIEDLWDLLQYHVTTYFDNDLAQVPPARHKSNRPLKTLAHRLKGKEGRFRYTLAGKRVNFCARSVISPDPSMSIDEVGVPVHIAKELTIPERVTEWNVGWLKEFIKNGSDVYPGANYVITDEGKRKKITDDTKEQILEELTPGWVVERHLLNGDVILFNRQPSLHRLSMMGHRTRLLPGRTFRIHPAVCRPYNADFDGDEMNLHLPQTEEARSEAESLLLLDKQVITPRYGLSIIGEVEDSLVGLYLLTRGDMWLDRKQASGLLIAAGVDEELPKPDGKELWNGRQIFSLILPKDMNFNRGHEEIKGEKKMKIVDVDIKDGKLVDGPITEYLVGPEKGVLIHNINKLWGPEKTKIIINAMNKMGLEVVKNRPYTLSFSDLDLSDRTITYIKSLVEEGEKEVQNILKLYEDNKIIPIPGKTVRETAEAKILFALNRLRTPIGEAIGKEAKEEKNFLILLSKCGLAGIYNLSMMSGLVGQQVLRGKRIHLGYTNRTLLHFERGDLGPKARGFIKHSYGEGLDPVETFFNAILGRDSLMDTAMRTPKSGYMQRRLINAMQDLKINYDGTIRDSGCRIVQFEFGGDNVDVAKSDGGLVEIE